MSVALAFVLFSLQGHVHEEFQLFSEEAFIFKTLSNTQVLSIFTQTETIVWGKARDKTDNREISEDYPRNVHWSF